MDATTQALVGMIGQVGFPIVVAGYVLVRMETTIKELTKAVNAMSVKLGLPKEDAPNVQ